MHVYKLEGKEYTDFDEFMAQKNRLEEIEKCIEKNTESLQPTKSRISVAEKKRRNRRKIFKVIRNTSVIFLCVSFIGMAVLLTINIRSEAIGRQKFSELRAQRDKNVSDYKGKKGAILPEYISLHADNTDLVGWLSIDYTSIDYPVMYKEGDNDYYLSKNFEKEYDANGMLILDKRCDPDGASMNSLIHGHNMKSGLMFGGLHKYLDEGYANDHKIIRFDTLYEKANYEIISVFVSSVDITNLDDFKFYDYINIEESDDYEEYIRGIKEQSVFDTPTTAEYGDKLITLSTCDYTKAGGRLVVVAKQVEENESK